MRRQSRSEALGNFGRGFGRIVMYVIFGIIVLNVLGGDDTSSSDTGSRIEDRTSTTESTAIVEADEPKEYDSVNYKEVARQKDGMAGKDIYIEGEVLQVTTSWGNVNMRVASHGDKDQIYYVTISEDDLEFNILEDDFVYVEGTLAGIKNLTSVLGSQISLPELNADTIELK